MTARILSGKEYAAKIKEAAKKEAESLGIRPGLAVVMVGDNPASAVYVRNKNKACEELGFHSVMETLPADTSKDELLAVIDRLNGDASIHGILVQLPLPAALSDAEQEVLNRISPDKDVDGFHPVNVGRLSTGQGALLLAKNATVTICHSHTKDLAKIAREADILVAAIGKPRFVTADMVKPGATVIDVGINRIEPKKLVGDVDFEAAQEVAGAITPVPGGVGLLTVAMLMQNVVTAARMQSGK